MSRYENFLQKVNEIYDIRKAAQLLGWDREVNMPAAATAERTAQIATLSRIAHELTSSDEFGALVESAAAELNGAGPDDDRRRLLDVVERQVKRSRALPAAFVQRQAQISGEARFAWVAARANNDFAAFQPYLEQIIELCQQAADYFGYENDPYDALLDLHEQGMKTSEVQALFEAVVAETKPLLAAIVERGRAIDDSVLHRPYDVEKQQQFARYIAAAVGYDFSRGHLGTVVHPFASGFSRNDVRITSRWNPTFISPGLFGTLHESGHAMYEQGTSPRFSRTFLARGTSMGIHESQSRMIENVVGRSRGFWERHFATLQNMFPDALGSADVDTFWRAINKVQPSYIRVEADELTYNFHIILRFELEQAMLRGELRAADLPDAWHSRFKELLGIVPPTDTLGCLQDVHWSSPSFGYFPTYALGNLYGAQFFAAMKAQEPTIEAGWSAGDTGPLLSWLLENIHVHGSKYPPGELVVRVTGERLSHQPFVDYVHDKFTRIYEL